MSDNISIPFMNLGHLLCNISLLETSSCPGTWTVSLCRLLKSFANSLPRLQQIDEQISVFSKVFLHSHTNVCMFHDNGEVGFCHFPGHFSKKKTKMFSLNSTAQYGSFLIKQTACIHLNFILAPNAMTFISSE